MLVCGCRFTVRWIVLHPSFLVIPFIGQTCLRLAADCAFVGGGSLFIFLLFGSSLFSVQTCTYVSRKVILCPSSVQAGLLPTGNWWRLDTHADLQRTCKQVEIGSRMPRPRWAEDGGVRGAPALPRRWIVRGWRLNLNAAVGFTFLG